MSDYITGLRGDLVDAADRHRRRRGVGRATRQLPARTWRPALAAATIVTGAVAVLVAANALSPSPPVRPGIAAVVQIGGQPQDAVAAGGSLWVTDFEGEVIRVDPETRRVIDRIDVEGNPSASPPAQAACGSPAPTRRRTSRCCPGSTRAAAGSSSASRSAATCRPSRSEQAACGSSTGTVHGSNGSTRSATSSRPELRSRRPGRWPHATKRCGPSATRDGRRRRRQLAGHPPPGPCRRAVERPVQNTLAADVDGAWVSDPSAGTVLRIHAGQVVSRTRVGDGAGPVAVGDGSVWAASHDPLAVNAPSRLSHIDPETETVTTTLDLEGRQPKALVTVGDDVWVIASDGTALLVENRASRD